MIQNEEERDDNHDQNDNLNRLMDRIAQLGGYDPIMFDEEYDNDDEVFEEYREVEETETVAVRRGEPRVRRVSDVIDSIGSCPSSPITRTSGNFEFTERTVTETKETDKEERSIKIVRREQQVKYYQLAHPPMGRLSSVTDGGGGQSPPTTPGSDQGYCTPPHNLLYRPKWFRFSTGSCEQPDQASPPKIDALDAQVMIPSEDTPTQEVSMGASGGEILYPKARMPVSLTSLEYNMGHSRVGHAVIFNHEEFTMEHTPQRVGSKLDANRLADTLTNIGFSVQIFHDLDSDKIKAKIIELASVDHTDCDCVLVAVLSHGMGTSYILSHDYPYPVDMLWSPFMPDRCPTLAGKPKLFLIQACRGDKLDGGVQLVKGTQVDSDSQTYKIPAMADFLIAYSTAEGFYSWRNPLKGTWFIQSLCEILGQNCFTEDFHNILLMVGQKVALEHESFSDLFPWQHQQKQVPQTVSTLIRKIRFQKKLPPT